MPILSKKDVLLIAAVVDIAAHEVAAPVKARDTAARLRVPPRHLEQQLQSLSGVGILASKRGPGGGYVLARDADLISAADVLHAVQPNRSSVKTGFSRIAAQLDGLFDNLTIADLLK